MTRGHDAVQMIQEIFLTLSQGGLVRYLEEVPHKLGTFAVQTARGEPDLGDPPQRPLDFLRQHEAWKMKQRRCSQSCADVGGTGSQETEFVVIGQLEEATEFLVQLVDPVPTFHQPQPGHQALQPQVVFLVDHDRHRVAAGHRHAHPAVRRGLPDQFARDKSSLKEDLLRSPAQFIHAHEGRVRRKRTAIHRPGHGPEDDFAIPGARPADVAVSLKVTGQPHPGGTERCPLRVPPASSQSRPKSGIRK